MKKILVLLLAAVCVLSACSPAKPAQESSSDASEPAEQSESAEPSEEQETSQEPEPEKPDTTEPGDFTWTETDEGIMLTSYTGSEAVPQIPDTIERQPVTAIGNGCFQGLLSLEKVHIPEGVQTIGDYAFECCGSLQKIYLPESLQTIGEGAFSGCVNLRLVDMQNGVQSIGRGAFLYCTALVYQDLSASLQEIGAFAFAGCNTLARVDFHQCPLEAVPDRLFYGCSSLVRVEVPDTVRTIGTRAFSGCEAMTGFYFGMPLEQLGAYAFENCRAMANADVAAVTLATGTFKSCGALQYYNVSAETKTIEEKAFAESTLEDIYLPEGIEEIAEGAFGSTSLRSISLENNANYQIVDGSLYSADGKVLLAYCPADPYAEEEQTTFVVPDGVEIIGKYAFPNCALTQIELPDSLKEIHAYAFEAVQVESLEIPDGVQVDPLAFGAVEESDDPGESAAEREAVETGSAAGDKSLFDENAFAGYKEISNEMFDDWAQQYMAYNEEQGVILDQEKLPYVFLYKGEVIPHYVAMTAVQNEDPDMWAEAEQTFGDDFAEMYRMMDHGLFTELGCGKMSDDLILYSGVYDSQLKAAAGMDTVPTQEQLVDAIGRTFTDPIMISTTTDPAIACGFGDTVFIIYASKEAMEDLGAVCIDAIAYSTEKEILMANNASYRILDVGTFAVPYTDEEGNEQAFYRDYVKVELLGQAEE